MTIIEYLIKFSLAITIVFLVYKFVLRGLTFYQWNRFYLLACSILCLFLPLINVSELTYNTAVEQTMVSHIPPVVDYIQPVAEQSTFYGSLALYIFIAGAIAALFRLGVQYLSLWRVKKRSVLLHRRDKISIYQSPECSAAFSFGNDIFINADRHSSDELQRILLHEMAHVRQRHTIDLAVGEMICVVNWFNPFAWLTRNAIRQNLEFIADQNVLMKGYDRTAYQYLLLKVIAAPQYVLVTHFNIPDLKKRIAMMNKMKSRPLQLAKFLFVLPVFAIMLLAFRNDDTGVVPYVAAVQQEVMSVDTLPPATPEVQTVQEPIQPPAPQKANKKGYALNVINSNGEMVVLIRNVKTNELQAMTMTEWNRNKRNNEDKYGKLPAAPSPPAPPAPPVPSVPPAPPVPQGDK